MAHGVKTGGRVKGKSNRVTVGAKANVMHVFDMLGGAKGFAEWAVENKTEFYRHYAKLIPTSNNTEVSGALDMNINVKFK